MTTDLPAEDPGQVEEASVDQAAVDRIVSAIGPRLRDLRLQQGLSLQQLAERAGVSAAAIHKIERSGMVPTITTLLKLADAFDRPVAYFVDEQSDAARPVAFTPAGAGRRVVTSHPGLDLRSISGSYGRFLLDTVMATVAPGFRSGEGPAYPRGEELLFMLSGTLEFDIEGRSYAVSRGDALHFRSDRPHRWWNAANEPALVVWVRLRPH